MFTLEQRQNTLDLILANLEKDTRIDAVLVVGSGAVGFDDDYSDIDLCIISQDSLVSSVYQDWRSRFEDLVTVIRCSEVTYGPFSYLYAFLLDGFLELDAGFIGIGSLVAKHERWAVAFDRSGNISQYMNESWNNRQEPDIESVYIRRLDGIWHHVIHVGASLKRGHLLRACLYIDNIRNRAVEIACLRYGLVSDKYRQADQLPDEFITKFNDSIITKIQTDALCNSLIKAVDLFFDEAHQMDLILGIDKSSTLKAKMNEYITLLYDIS